MRLVLAGCLVFLLLAAAAPAQAAFPGDDGRIALVYGGSDEETGSVTAIGDVRPFGRGQDRELRGCHRDDQGVPDGGDCSIEYHAPAYSPDGRRVAFDAGARLALMRSDGSGFRLLPQQTADDGEPAFSPHGGRLVFTGHAAPGGQPDLHVLNLATGTSRRLTFRGGSQPAWSTRNRIAFVRDGRLHLLRPDGTGLRKLTLRGGSEPDWSPDGRRLVFVRRGSLHVMRIGLRGARRIRSTGDFVNRHVYEPVWSPSGRFIAYYADEAGIFSIRTNGTAWAEVAPSQAGDTGGHSSSEPAWQPLVQTRAELSRAVAAAG